jgi:hypothetical protein
MPSQNSRTDATCCDHSFGAVTDRNSVSSPSLQKAFDLLTSSDAQMAFDLQSELPAVRERYGLRTIGQSCLLARRLVERGVPLITVNNIGWDTHANLYTSLKEGYMGAKQPVGLIPSLDQAFSALLEDLSELSDEKSHRRHAILPRCLRMPLAVFRTALPDINWGGR